MIELLFLTVSTVCFKVYDKENFDRNKIIALKDQCVQEVKTSTFAPTPMDGEQVFRVVPATECVKIGHDWEATGIFANDKEGIPRFWDDQCSVCRKLRVRVKQTTLKWLYMEE